MTVELLFSAISAVHLLDISSITLLSPIGLALLIAGLHIIYKNISAITVGITTAPYFISGALAPITDTPLLQAIDHIAPLGTGIEIMRRSLSQSDIPLYFYAILAINSLGWLAIGLYTLRYSLEEARHAGTLAHY